MGSCRESTSLKSIPEPSYFKLVSPRPSSPVLGTYIDCIGEGCTTCSEWDDCGFGYVLEADMLDVVCDSGNTTDYSAEGCFEKCCECECARRVTGACCEP